MTHPMMMNHKDTVPRTAEDDDAHAAKDTATEAVAMEIRIQDRTKVEDSEAVVGTMAAAAAVVVEVTPEERECDKPTRVRLNPSPPSTT